MMDTRIIQIFSTLVLSSVQGLPNYSSYAADSIRNQKAENIRKYMNLTVDPCENFYEFACGNWATYYPANTSVLETSPLQLITAEANRELSKLITSYSSSDSITDQKVKDFYQSCLNLHHTKAIYHSKLREIVKEFGQMPLLEGPRWQESQFDWLETVAKIYHKFDIAILLSYTVGVEKIVMISHHDLGMGEHTLYLEENKKSYRQNYKKNVAYYLESFLGVNQTLADQTAKEFLDFEIALAAGIAKGTTSEGEMYVEMTVDEMQEKYAPDLDIKKFLQIAFERIPSGEIGEKAQGYIESLLQAIKTTPKRVVANYVFYFMLRPFIMFIPKSPMTLASNCLVKTKTHFPEAVDNMIYRRYNIRETEQSILNLFYDLKSIFKSHLNSDKYYWMAKSTRKHAIKKLTAMEIVFNSFTDVNFDEKYSRVTMTNNDYIANMKSILSGKGYQTRSNFGKIGTPRVTNFMYLMHSNKVQVAIPLLQPDLLWSASYPVAVNFGTLGAVLAHEIVHAFDSDSISYNENGEESDWFDANSRKAFDERVQCLKYQFGNYTYYGNPLPQMDSQAENIADGSGMRLLYDVYSAWRNNAWRPQASTNSEMLTQLNYSPEQLLFISFAQFWCADISPVYRKMKTDEHAPESLRVTATLSNLDEFSVAFRCPKGSPMNPEKKCEIY